MGQGLQSKGGNSPIRAVEKSSFSSHSTFLFILDINLESDLSVKVSSNSTIYRCYLWIQVPIRLFFYFLVTISKTWNTICRINSLAQNTIRKRRVPSPLIEYVSVLRINWRMRKRFVLCYPLIDTIEFHEWEY